MEFLNNTALTEFIINLTVQLLGCFHCRMGDNVSCQKKISHLSKPCFKLNNDILAGNYFYFSKHAVNEHHLE